LAWCCVSCGDRIRREVIQEAYVKIWNSAGQFQSRPGVADHVDGVDCAQPAIDVVRKRGEVSIEEEPAAMEVAADIADPLARREMTEELKRLLECVGVWSRIGKSWCCWLLNGWSREQLAAKFETPVNTVKTWLRRSMMDIGSALEFSSVSQEFFGL